MRCAIDDRCATPAQVNKVPVAAMQGRMRPAYMRQRIDVFIEGHKDIQLEDAPFRVRAGDGVTSTKSDG